MQTGCKKKKKCLRATHTVQEQTPKHQLTGHNVHWATMAFELLLRGKGVFKNHQPEEKENHCAAA